MHHPTIGSTELESVFTHCQNWRSACAKMTVVDYLLSPVCQKAPRRRRGAFFCWNADRREFPRVRDIGQSAAWQWGILFAMPNEIRILKVEKDGEDGLIVTFSDGTTAGYVVEELLLLRPIREAVKEPLKSDRPTTIVTKIRFSVGASYST